ncbi:MAG: hypothetical protein ABJD53_13980 [Gammaproteobacteria bacterium]
MNSAFYTSFGLMIPMGIGFLTSPAGATLEVAVSNRLAGVIVIWLAAILLRHNMRLIKERDRAVTRLQASGAAAERAGDARRSGLSDWMQRVVGSSVRFTTRGSS